MADDYEIKNDDKAIEDLINSYQKERLQNRKKEIIKDIENEEEEEEKKLGQELQDIIIKLSKMK